MNEREYFWAIVNDSTKEKNREKQREFIYNCLMKKSIDDVVLFKKILNEVEKETRNHSNFTWIFRLAGIGDSFDSECYFSAWLVSLGERKRKMILDNPMTITELVELEDEFIKNYEKFTHELFSYVPSSVLKKRGFEEFC